MSGTGSIKQGGLPLQENKPQTEHTQDPSQDLQAGVPQLQSEQFQAQSLLAKSSPENPHRDESGPLVKMSTNSQMTQLELARDVLANQGNIPGQTMTDALPNSYERTRHFDACRPVDCQGSTSCSRSPDRFYQAQNWSVWPDVTILVRGIPNGITTRELWQSFEDMGSLVFIDIAEENYNKGFARIRFEPPPTRDFWNPPPGRWNVRFGQRLYWVHLSLEPRRRTIDTVPSPADPGFLFPTKILLHPSRMQFCVLRDVREMTVMRTIEELEEDEEKGLKFDVDVGHTNITAYFSVPIKVLKKPILRYYKARINFSHITKTYRTQLSTGQWALTIPLEFPPRYYYESDELGESLKDDKLQWHRGDLWHRATHILEDDSILTGKPLALNFGDGESIEIGRWTTFRFVLDDGPKFHLMLKALHDWNIDNQLVPDFRMMPNTSGPWKFLEPPLPPKDSEDSTLATLALLEKPAIENMPFPIRYQLEVCLSRKIFVDQSIDEKFLSRLASLPKDRGRRLLEFYCDQGGMVYDPMSIFDNEDALYYCPTSKIPEYCAVVRKALITPTTIHYSTPNVEVDNRVLRKYRDYQDYFLRVQFVDEMPYGRLATLVDKTKDEDVFKRMYRGLRNGIHVGGRLYKFLAFGNSQFRECGAYFFSEPEHGGITCDSMRNWMGSFSHIKVVAKYAARLGQCFSTTKQVKSINVPPSKLIPDIERNGFTFTDGVGKISLALAAMVVSSLSDNTSHIPSAFQFRMGGCKGVLTMWDDVKGMEVHVRPSQEKFKSEYNGLEIIKWSDYSVATLNRQTIVILSALGLQSKAFLDLLEKQLTEYEKAMVHVPTAISLLNRFVDENQMSIAISEMLSAGFMHEEIQEPFVLTLLRLWKNWSMKLLKEKARIVVEKGAFVLGCADETGTLRGHSKETEGGDDNDVKKIPQIFLQINKSVAARKERTYEVIKGICIVGRNPSLHPGDIRVVEAVDIPALHHLRDVVVFPTTGDRDVPSMLSGGDLDGDEFFVIWEPSLIPSEWHHPPMDYQGPPPTVLDRDVMVRDLTQFFVLHAMNDSLSQIAPAHLAQADFLKEGAKAKKCLDLAKLHSQAVDYNKTGIPAVMPKELRPRKWPHFMERKRASTYPSTSALGKIYDRVQKEHFNPLYTNSFDSRILTAFKLNEEILGRARGVKRQYDIAMRRLMGQRDIATEFEIWTGFALSRPRVGSDYKLQEDLGREGAALKNAFRKHCVEVAGVTTQTDHENLAPFVAAMYQVTWEEVKEALKLREERERKQQRWLEEQADAAAAEQQTWENQSTERTEGEADDDEDQTDFEAPLPMPLISFPWLFHSILGKIANGYLRQDKFDPYTGTPKDVVAVEVPSPRVTIPQTDASAEKVETTQDTEAEIPDPSEHASPVSAEIDFSRSESLDAAMEYQSQESISAREQEVRIELEQDNAVDRLLELIGGLQI